MTRADLITALVLVGFGLLVVWWSWEMPRLQNRRIHPLTVPGLVPGLLGLALTLCGALLGLGALRRMRGDGGGWAALGAALTGSAARRVAVLAVLILVFTLGLVGRVPFWLASGLFLFVTIATFELVLTDAPRPRVPALIWAAGLAVVVSALVTGVFQYGFLVRLPGS